MPGLCLHSALAAAPPPGTAEEPSLCMLTLPALPVPTEDICGLSQELRAHTLRHAGLSVKLRA